MYFLGEEDWIKIGIVGAVITILIAFTFGFLVGNNVAGSFKSEGIDKVEEIVNGSSSIAEKEEVEVVEEEMIEKANKAVNLTEGVVVNRSNNTINNSTVNFSEETKVPKISFRNFSLSTKYGEKFIILSERSKKLNINESLGEVFDEEIDKEYFPLFLGSDFKVANNFKQTIKISENLTLKKFSNNDYLDGQISTGFELIDGDFVLDYVIDFGTDVLFNDLIGEKINILGRNYKIIEIDFEEKEILLLVYPYEFIFEKYEIVNIKTPIGDSNVSVLYIGDDKVIFEIDGKKIETLHPEEYFEADNFIIFIGDILNFGKSNSARVEVVVSPKLIILNDGAIKTSNGESDELRASFISEGDFLEKIIISWNVDEDFFITNKVRLDMPIFGTIDFSLGKKLMDEDDEDYWRTYFNVKSYDYSWEEINF